MILNNKFRSVVSLPDEYGLCPRPENPRSHTKMVFSGGGGLLNQIIRDDRKSGVEEESIDEWRKR